MSLIRPPERKTRKSGIVGTACVAKLWPAWYHSRKGNWSPAVTWCMCAVIALSCPSQPMASRSSITKLCLLCSPSFHTIIDMKGDEIHTCRRRALKAFSRSEHSGAVFHCYKSLRIQHCGDSQELWHLEVWRLGAKETNTTLAPLTPTPLLLGKRQVEEGSSANRPCGCNQDLRATGLMGRERLHALIFLLALMSDISPCDTNSLCRKRRITGFADRWQG